MWRWQGVCSVILAIGVTGTLLTFTITGAVNPGRATPITTEEASALTTVLGAVIGALAVFLGVRNGHRPDPPPRVVEAPPMMAPPDLPPTVRDRAEASLDAAVAEAKLADRSAKADDELPGPAQGDRVVDLDSLPPGGV